MQLGEVVKDISEQLNFIFNIADTITELHTEPPHPVQATSKVRRTYSNYEAHTHTINKIPLNSVRNISTAENLQRCG